MATLRPIWDLFGINLGSFGDNLLAALGYLGGRLVTNRWVDNHLVTTEGSIGCHLVTTWTVIAWWPLWDQFGIPWWPLCDYFVKCKHLSNQKTYCASNHDHFKTILQCTTKWTFTFTAARLIERWLQIDTSFSIWFGMRDMSKKSRGVVGRGLERP